MQAEKKGFVRTTYVSRKDHKVKFLQASIKKHGSKEKALEFLKELKARKISEEAADLSSKQLEAPIYPLDDLKDHPNKDVPPIPNDPTNDKITNNLMDEKVNSSSVLDNIMVNLKYSPFKLEVNPQETGTSITIFGSSKSYKTTLLKRILKKYYSEDCVTLLCAQNLHADIYKDLPKEIIKMDAYSSAIVKAMWKINKKTDNKYPFVIAIDDIIDEKNDKDLEKLFLTLRNSKISVIILLQHVSLLKSSARGNSNIVIFRKFNQQRVVEDYVMKHYLKNYPPFKDLRMSDAVSLYMAITNKHDYFVLDVLNNTLTVHHEEEAN